MENSKEFYEKVCNAVGKSCPDSTVKLCEVLKNNGLVRHGLTVVREGDKMSPVIYLEAFEKLYNEGTSLGEIVDRLVRFLDMQSYTGINVDKYTDFENVKDGIVYKVINYDLNRELLENVPYIRWNDLAICFYYVCARSDDGCATIMVKNEHMKIWNIECDELYDYARVNTPRIMEDELQTMSSVLQTMLGEEFETTSDMYVLTNKSRIFGATCILYSKAIRELSVRYQEGLYILPSSIHEVIILPADESYDTDYLKEMICEVNETEVSIEEKLSDNLYYYDPDRDVIRIA